jgi:crossover junction endodeoxyribonuclease RuvC
MKIIGIDPGKAGGLSFCEDGEIKEVIPMPTYEMETSTKNKTMVDFVEVGKFIKKHKPEKIYIEQVGAMPGQGVTSMFSFGFSTGGLHGVCGALEIPIKLVTPRKWQKSLMGDDTHVKLDTIEFCTKNFPNTSLLATKRSKKSHDGMADSVAISFYGYKQESNNINKE